MAANNRGALLQTEGDAEGSKAASQFAVDSDAGRAAKAAFNLGATLEKGGDVGGAKAAYQLMIYSGGQDAARRPK